MKTSKIISYVAVLLLASTTVFAGGTLDLGAKAKSGSSSNSQQGQSTSIDSHNYSKGSDVSRMVGSAVAPSLTTTLTETCMGSSSGGAGFAGGSITFGTTWTDSACVRRLDAREIRAIHPNFAVVAKELMCDSQQVYDAFKRAGIPCVVRKDHENHTDNGLLRSTRTRSINKNSSKDNGFF